MTSLPCIECMLTCTIPMTRTITRYMSLQTSVDIPPGCSISNDGVYFNTNSRSMHVNTSWGLICGVRSGYTTSFRSDDYVPPAPYFAQSFVPLLNSDGGGECNHPDGFTCCRKVESEEIPKTFDAAKCFGTFHGRVVMLNKTFVGNGLAVLHFGNCGSDGSIVNVSVAQYCNVIFGYVTLFCYCACIYVWFFLGFVSCNSSTNIHHVCTPLCDVSTMYVHLCAMFRPCMYTFVRCFDRVCTPLCDVPICVLIRFLIPIPQHTLSGILIWNTAQ